MPFQCSFDREKRMPLIGLLLHRMMPIGCRFTSTARDDHTRAHARPVRERVCTPRRDSHAQAHGGGHTVLLVGVFVLGVGGSLGSSPSAAGAAPAATRRGMRQGQEATPACPASKDCCRKRGPAFARLREVQAMAKCIFST